MTRKIMLVEDDQPILDMMEILLKRIGYEPVLVPDVKDALERVRTDPPALILLDIMMSPINGWQFLETLRNEYQIRELPVILFRRISIISRMGWSSSTSMIFLVMVHVLLEYEW